MQQIRSNLYKQLLSGHNSMKTGLNLQKICPFPMSTFVCQVHQSQHKTQKHSCNVLVVGGGSGGCGLAAKLAAKLGPNKVIVLEPSEKHYYQPMFTLVGGGMKSLEATWRPMAEVLPRQAKWLQDKAVEFSPTKNCVTTSQGAEIQYDILVLALGLKLNYEGVPGLVEALSIPNGKVCSNYSPKYVNRVLECLRNIQEGEAVFTFPASPVKCPGAPQKIAYISEHYFRKLGKRDRINITYNTALPVIFGVKHYADALWKVVEKRNIKVNTRRNLIEVKPESDIAVFQDLDNLANKYEQKYSMLHAVPPMAPPPELSHNKEITNEAGFVDVDKSTLQHTRFSNIYAIGDCSSTPNSKTAASAAAQTPVVYKNILNTLNGYSPKEVYDGYASCPLVTGYNSCILAEFDYSLTPLETFPITQDRERYSMFLLKKHFMPALYWQLMLKGHWGGPALMRKLMAPLKRS